jgi:hypothetical protein
LKDWEKELEQEKKDLEIFLLFSKSEIILFFIIFTLFIIFIIFYIYFIKIN